MPGDDPVFCHGDPGPWNYVWHGQEAVALLDWDFLHPGPRVDDVAYALRWFAPLRNDEHALEWHHFPDGRPTGGPASRRTSRRTATWPPFDVVTEVAAVMRRTRDRMAELAAQGVEPQRHLGAPRARSTTRTRRSPGWSGTLVRALA